MAKDTKYNARKISIYQMFPFIYSKEGTLNKASERLGEIKDMGFDYVYLLPIHERGKLNSKGTYGSPYAIRDYYSIDKHIGTINDFEQFVKKAHSIGLKVMIDVVFNHSACDCVYTKNHPEYYLKDKEGNFTRKVADWSDVYDFDYSCKELRKELIKVLKYWANKGIDGIRCDVASLVPVNFWKEARRELKKINPDFFMLAESTHMGLVMYMRYRGYYAASDNDLYEAFDALYSYDIAEEYNAATTKDNLLPYIRAINYQQGIFPKNALKLYHLENHDYPRIYSLVKNKTKVRQWVSFSFLAKGVSFVYAGQECYASHLPNFFEKEDLDWTKLDKNYVALITKLNKLKKSMFNDNSYIDYKLYPNAKALIFSQRDEKEEYFGIFNVTNSKGEVEIDIDDGEYVNLIDDEKIIIKKGKTSLINKPILIKRVNLNPDKF